MTISLRRFLQTGHLGHLHVELSAEEVQAIVGPPENTAKTFRRHRLPDIWLYGGVEVWLDQSSPQICRGIWIERMGQGWNNEFKMPSDSVVEDWGLQPYSPRDAVEDYLRNNGIAAFQPETVGRKGVLFAPRHFLVSSSGVTLSFDEDWRLSAFLARQVDLIPSDTL